MIKDIVVHLTGSAEDDTRLAYAAQLARMFDAHLTGLQVHSLPEVIAFAEPAGSAFLQELLVESHQRAQVVTDALREKLNALGLRSELRRIDAYPGSVGRDLAAEARSADLFVGTRPYGDPTGEERIEETVLFQSGRAAFFAPPGGKAPRDYATVIVAWKPRRESARALAESMPFLRKAKQVIVVIVEEKGATEQQHIEVGADIGRHLSRHGISCEIRKVAGWDRPSEALLNEVEKAAADLVVMGGYGHSKFREWALGGMTRDLLGSAAVPVLMAH